MAKYLNISNVPSVELVAELRKRGEYDTNESIDRLLGMITRVHGSIQGMLSAYNKSIKYTVLDSYDGDQFGDWEDTKRWKILEFEGFQGYYRVLGTYTSYGRGETSWNNSLEPVKAVEKTVTVYESCK